MDLLKLLGSIVLGTGIAFIFAARVNRLAKTKITTIPYTKQYDINDTPEHYEYNQQKDGSIHEVTPAGDVILLYDKDKEQSVNLTLLENLKKLNFTKGDYT